jgi:hypothetical protein
VREHVDDTLPETRTEALRELTLVLRDDDQNARRTEAAHLVGEPVQADAGAKDDAPGKRVIRKRFGQELLVFCDRMDVR